MKKRDLIWKGVIREFFPHFIQFFFPNWEQEIDLSKGYEFLDKELEQILPEAEAKGRRADVLVKVFSPKGEEFWFLVHVEVQGYADEEFAERMYAVQYRLYDRFRKPVGALAILTDVDPNFHPKAFYFKCLSTELRYDFSTFKVLDNPPEQFAYLKPNPFALIMEAAWHGLHFRKKKDDEKLEEKTKLAWKLVREGYPKETIHDLLSFIKYYTPFENMDYYLKFDENFQPMKEIPNTVREAILIGAKEEAREEGLEEGREQGLEKGEAIGIEKTLAIIKALKTGTPAKEIAEKMKVKLALVNKVKKQIEEVN